MTTFAVDGNGAASIALVIASRRPEVVVLYPERVQSHRSICKVILPTPPRGAPRSEDILLATKSWATRSSSTGLAPVILLRNNFSRRLVDARIKSGHDD